VSSEVETLNQFLATNDEAAEDVNSDKVQLHKSTLDGLDKFKSQGTNVELLWRLARSAYKAAAVHELKGDKDSQKRLLLEAEDWAKKSLEVDPGHFQAHAWYAYVNGKLSNLVSTKEKIQRGKLVQSHLEEAIKLKPDEYGLYYTYGRWCIEVAKLSWMERKIASTLFDTPPEATYEDAIKQFKEAEKLKQDWKANYFYLAKAFVALKNYKEAIKYLDLGSKCPIKDEEDKIIEDELASLQSKYASYR